jgi:hypothetical protein
MHDIRQVPRLEDLPYASSPPIEFTYSSEAPFASGMYTWSDPPSSLTPNRPVMANCLYFFRSVTFIADIQEVDYVSDVVDIPKFQMYLRSTGKTILFREPIYMVKYFQNFDYRLTWISQQDNDTLFAAFSGVLNQSIGTVGKAGIKLTAIISAQEIVDQGYIRMFKELYPELHDESGRGRF